jgi:hypothetical protein
MADETVTNSTYFPSFSKRQFLKNMNLNFTVDTKPFLYFSFSVQNYSYILYFLDQVHSVQFLLITSLTHFFSVFIYFTRGPAYQTATYRE